MINDESQKWPERKETNEQFFARVMPDPLKMVAAQTAEVADELDAFTEAMRALPLNDYFGEFVERMYDAEMLPEAWQPMET